MKHSAIVLDIPAREAACAALVEKLKSLDAELLIVSVAATHAHAVCRFANWKSPGMAIPGLCEANALRDGRDPVPRHVLGVAMKHASHELRLAKLKRPGPLWAARAKLVTIKDRGHQVRAVRYVHEHLWEEQAVIWTMWHGLVLPAPP